MELARAVLILRRRPFAETARHLTRPARPIAADDLLPMRVRWAVQTMSRHVPWRSVCFDQAIAAQLMLRRRGIAAELVYGVRQAGGRLDAHVWVRLADSSIILGGEASQLFRPVAIFRPGQQDMRPPLAD